MNPADHPGPTKPKAQQAVYVRNYFTKGLCAIYNNIDRKTFRKWLRPFLKELGKRNGYYWSIHQVRIIFKRLELPSHIIVVDEYL